MSELNVIGPIEGESTDLGLHVDICSQRYGQLIGKFNEVDQRLDHISSVCEEIKQTLQASQKENFQRYLAWAGGIIAVLVGVVVTLAVR
jgi:hypothetical protein